MNRHTLLLALFATATAVLSLWSERHFPIGIGEPGPLTAVIVAVTGGLTAIDRLLGTGQAKSLRELLRKKARKYFPHAACAITILAGTVVFCVSSVLVIPEEVGTSGGYQLRAVSDSVARDPITEDPLRFMVWSGPFGRQYELTAPVYLPEIIDVHPVTGVTIRPGRDMRPVPSALFRPPAKALTYLSSDGYFVLEREDGTELARGVCDDECSFVIGLQQPLPEMWRQLWRWELEGQGLQPSVISRTMRAWHRLEQVELPEPLKPGMKLRAFIRSAGNKERAEGQWIVGTEPIVDVGFEYIPPRIN